MLERIIGFRVRHAGQRIKKPMAVGKKMFRSIELWLRVYMPPIPGSCVPGQRNICTTG